jgi:universal stress protein E
MQTPGSILVILDKPKHEQVALERALTLARAGGSHLHLVSFCYLPMVDRSDVFDTHQRRAIKKSALAERRRWLDGLIRDRDLAAADISTEIVWTDDIAAWVTKLVSGNGPQLVVKTVHHSRTLLHTPLDWALLRQCPVPLLLVSGALRKASGAVLACIDSAGADARHRRLDKRVADAAAWLSDLSAAKLHVVSVVEIHASFEDLEYFDSRKNRSKAKQATADYLNQVVADLKVTKSRMHLPFGKVGQVVADVAEKQAVDVVVVGTGASRGLGAKLLGSSAEKILSRVSCDVLAVHL